MRRFRWLGAKEIPNACDLRRCGWSLAGDAVRPDDHELPIIADRRRVDGHGWLSLLTGKDGYRIAKVVLTGVGSADERATLLRLGFGDVLGARPDLGELEARAMRVAAARAMLPRYRQLGKLTLDLLGRDGRVDSQSLGLHPREFALAWRLMGRPGEPVCKADLLREVWGLRHIPETNSLAVHVARLRAKLRSAGLDDVLCTTADGSYYLCAVRENLPSRRSMDRDDQCWSEWPAPLWQGQGS